MTREEFLTAETQHVQHCILDKRNLSPFQVETFNSNASRSREFSSLSLLVCLLNISLHCDYPRELIVRMCSDPVCD